MSNHVDADWAFVRIGAIVAAAVVTAQLAGGIGYAVIHDDPLPRDVALVCLEREKGLVVRTDVPDPIAGTAAGGALATDVEGNGVVVVFASSTRQAAELMRLYEAGAVIRPLQLEIRGNVVLHFHRPASPTQRQTLYDCVG